MPENSIKEHLTTHGFIWDPEVHPYGISGFMSYGPAGKALKTNLEAEFRDVFQREGFSEIETPILLSQDAWEASGHLPQFAEEMFSTQRGLIARPEIATTIYPLFNQLLRANRGNMPIRAYQTGPAMPNDKQTEWQTRTRQYTAHEGHLFLESNDVNEPERVEYLGGLAFELMNRAGLSTDRLTFRQKTEADVPFYATTAYGLYTRQANGEQLELLGIQYRSSRDFAAHSERTGVALKVNGNYPVAFEISFSSDRPLLMLLEQSLKTIDHRAVLQLPDQLAPFPLQIFTHEKAADLQQRAKQLSDLLSKSGVYVSVDSDGAIGSRYKWADAVGTPYVVTVDRKGMSDDSYTLRDRDTRNQTRLIKQDLEQMLSNNTSRPPITGLLRLLYNRGESVTSRTGDK